jgi:DNA-binding IclR family transcriptional regulator
MTTTRLRPPARTTSTEATLLTVERGMQVLRAFRCERSAVSNAELVRRTGLSKATVSRLTSTFLQLGFLRHVAGGREFELGTGPLSIGHSFIEASPLVRTANPFLQALADKLNVSVALAVPNGLEMLYICYRTSDRIATLRLGVGSLLPLGTTSIGRAWLWALAPAEQKRRIAELKRAAGGRGAALEQGIRESFAELETTGTCAVLGGYQRDAYGVATPVRVGRNGTPMGLSCGNAEVAPNVAQARKRIGPELKKAAVQLEALLADTDGLP